MSTQREELVHIILLVRAHKELDMLFIVPGPSIQTTQGDSLPLAVVGRVGALLPCRYARCSHQIEVGLLLDIEMLAAEIIALK